MEKSFTDIENPSWDKTYTDDLSTHAQNPQHIGTTWFSDTLASSKTLTYLLSLPLSQTTTTFLDLGTGNGEMLFLLREEGGFRGRMLGVDYSAASVELANKIAAVRKGLGAGAGATAPKEVEFRVWDILKGGGGLEDLKQSGGFDVVLDKGTFDAVSLSDEVDERGRRLCEGYRERVEGLVKGNGGRLLVTSCNWTEEELRNWFEEGELVFEGRIEYPRFSFGGQTGQSVSSVCFRRK